MYIMDGFKGVKETFPATLVVAVTFTVLQVLIAAFAGPELADIIPGLVAMIALALFSKNGNLKIFSELIKMKKQMPCLNILLDTSLMHGARLSF